MQELNVWAIVSSLNQISNFSSKSKMAIYLESLSSMVHFPFNHVKELESLVITVPNGKSKFAADFFCSDLKFTAVHSLKGEERWSVNSSSL